MLSQEPDLCSAEKPRRSQSSLCVFITDRILTIGFNAPQNANLASAFFSYNRNTTLAPPLATGKNSSRSQRKNSAREQFVVQKHFFCGRRESGESYSFFTAKNVQRIIARFCTMNCDRELSTATGSDSRGKSKLEPHFSYKKCFQQEPHLCSAEKPLCSQAHSVFQLQKESALSASTLRKSRTLLALFGKYE